LRSGAGIPSSPSSARATATGPVPARPLAFGRGRHERPSPMLENTAIFLAAAVALVPIFKRLGLGSVLGYLAAGAIIGPSGLGLIDDVGSTMRFAEFGVVLLLFLIGLELEPSRLWRLRGTVFGLGAAQVLLSTAVLALGG